MELRSATPPPMHSLLKDLFEEITFWELRANSIEVQAAGKAYRVILRVEAQKLKGDGAGKERPVPMNEMKFAELGSSGACETSAFHQLLRGNSGSGPGNVPLSVAAAVGPESGRGGAAGRRDRAANSHYPTAKISRL